MNTFLKKTFVLEDARIRFLKMYIKHSLLHLYSLCFFLFFPQRACRELQVARAKQDLVFLIIYCTIHRLETTDLQEPHYFFNCGSPAFAKHFQYILTTCSCQDILGVVGIYHSIAVSNLWQNYKAIKSCPLRALFFHVGTANIFMVTFICILCIGLLFTTSK